MKVHKYVNKKVGWLAEASGALPPTNHFLNYVFITITWNISLVGGEEGSERSSSFLTPNQTKSPGKVIATNFCNDTFFGEWLGKSSARFPNLLPVESTITDKGSLSGTGCWSEEPKASFAPTPSSPTATLFRLEESIWLGEELRSAPPTILSSVRNILCLVVGGLGKEEASEALLPSPTQLLLHKDLIMKD